MTRTADARLSSKRLASVLMGLALGLSGAYGGPVPPESQPVRLGSVPAAVHPFLPALVGGAPQQRLTQPLLESGALLALRRSSADNAKGRLQIGVGRRFATPAWVDGRSPVSRMWTVLPNGWRVWSVEVASGGALGLRVRLGELSLPKGALVLAYSAAHPPPTVVPVTSQELSGRSELWTETVFDERVIVECQVPPDADLAAVRFGIADVSHIYELPKAGTQKEGTCENDVTCHPDWAREASGTARILFVDAGNTYLCTGCLVNANDPASLADYFLTANHCVGGQAVASTLELYWFYQTSTCNGPAPALSSVPHTSGGADLLSGSSVNDFAFLRLRRAPPAGAARLNWASSLPANGESVTAIHHPGAAYKRISFGNEVGSDGSFWQVRWSSGVTEPGSSGSPLFNSSHQIIGQLYGGNSSCTLPSGIDIFGRFDQTYNSVRGWIDPGGTGSGNGPPPIQVPRGATYYGLFADPGVAAQSAGSIVLTMGAKNRFSASLRLGGSRFAVSGQFDATGSAQVGIPNRNVTLSLQVDASDLDKLSGQVSSGGWTAPLTGNRAVYNSRSSPAPQAGRYTLMFGGGADPSTQPSGSSYGVINVDSAGRVSFAGRLADGTAITQSSFLSKEGFWPVHVPVYAGQGLLFGWLSFGDSAQAISGTLTWARPATAGAQLFSNGFEFQSPAAGSRYISPGVQGQLLNSATASLVLGGLAQNVVLDISVSKSRVSKTKPTRLNLAFAMGTGLFSGRVVDPGTGKLIPFSGVVIQNQNLGAGFYLTATEAGPVWLRGN